jgi:putative flippase GtrA
VAIQNKEQKLRFILVGGVNTALDFGLLFILKSLGLPVITANLISTSTAFCFSYFANKKYTFKTTDVNIKREVILFIVVTLFGLWVLQTIVIQVVSAALSATGLPSTLMLLLAKIVATIVSLVWNYVLYSRLVFSSRTTPTDPTK